MSTESGPVPHSANGMPEKSGTVPPVEQRRNPNKLSKTGRVSLFLAAAALGIAGLRNTHDVHAQASPLKSQPAAGETSTLGALAQDQFELGGVVSHVYVPSALRGAPVSDRIVPTAAALATSTEGSDPTPYITSSPSPTPTQLAPNPEGTPTPETREKLEVSRGTLVFINQDASRLGKPTWLNETETIPFEKLRAKLNSFGSQIVSLHWDDEHGNTYAVPVSFLNGVPDINRVQIDSDPIRPVVRTIVGSNDPPLWLHSNKGRFEVGGEVTTNEQEVAADNRAPLTLKELTNSDAYRGMLEAIVGEPMPAEMIIRFRKSFEANRAAQRSKNERIADSDQTPEPNSNTSNGELHWRIDTDGEGRFTISPLDRGGRIKITRKILRGNASNGTINVSINEDDRSGVLGSWSRKGSFAFLVCDFASGATELGIANFSGTTAVDVRSVPLSMELTFVPEESISMEIYRDNQGKDVVRIDRLIGAKTVSSHTENLSNVLDNIDSASVRYGTTSYDPNSFGNFAVRFGTNEITPGIDDLSALGSRSVLEEEIVGGLQLSALGDLRSTTMAQAFIGVPARNDFPNVGSLVRAGIGIDYSRQIGDGHWGSNPYNFLNGGMGVEALDRLGVPIMDGLDLQFFFRYSDPEFHPLRNDIISRTARIIEGYNSNPETREIRAHLFNQSGNFYVPRDWTEAEQSKHISETLGQIEKTIYELPLSATWGQVLNWRMGDESIDPRLNNALINIRDLQSQGAVIKRLAVDESANLSERRRILGMAQEMGIQVQEVLVYGVGEEGLVDAFGENGQIRGVVQFLSNFDTPEYYSKLDIDRRPAIGSVGEARNDSPLIASQNLVNFIRRLQTGFVQSKGGNN